MRRRRSSPACSPTTSRSSNRSARSRCAARGLVLKGASLAVALGLAAAGCGSNNPPPETSGPPPCSGDLVAIVTNDANYDVDVLANVRGSRTPRALGMVAAHQRQEFVLPS